MRTISDKDAEKQNTYFMFNNHYFENHIFYETMWKNNVNTDRPKVTI